MFRSPTKTAKKIFPEDASTRSGPTEPRKGHGRLGADRYTGGGLVKLPHPSLVSGAPCPLCLKGKVYELAMPSTFVRTVGSAPLQSTVFELGRIGCNLCGQIFKAPEPEGTGEGKNDDSAAAMIAVLKHGCGMPFYRLEKLQQDLDMPVPGSTRWEILEEA